jgi:hypothetical protein
MSNGFSLANVLSGRLQPAFVRERFMLAQLPHGAYDGAGLFHTQGEKRCT